MSILHRFCHSGTGHHINVKTDPDLSHICLKLSGSDWIFQTLIPIFMASNHNYDKKPTTFVSPDLSKLQAVVIDVKTILYIALDADPVLAKSSYLSRVGMKKL